jgi:hypothetical protein
MTTLWYCPFCKEEIARASDTIDADAVEARLSRHITTEHPIRRRLSRKFRRAFKAMAKIEDDVAAVGQIVTDTQRSTWFGVLQLEDMREQLDELKRIVDRRTRGAANSQPRGDDA